MDENWESATKPTHIMREVLITPKPGLGMLALALGTLLVGLLLFVAGAGTGHRRSRSSSRSLCGILGLYGPPRPVHGQPERRGRRSSSSSASYKGTKSASRG